MASSAATVRDYDIPLKRNTSGLPEVKFTVTGEGPYVLILPKTSIAISMVDLMENRSRYTESDFGRKLAGMLWQFIGYVKEEKPVPLRVKDPATGKLVIDPEGGKPRGRARLIQRISDPDDGMDIIDLEPIFRDASYEMFDRPTGPSLASSAKRPSASRASGAATRARRGSTSGTSRRRSS